MFFNKKDSFFTFFAKILPLITRKQDPSSQYSPRDRLGEAWKYQVGFIFLLLYFLD